MMRWCSWCVIVVKAMNSFASRLSRVYAVELRRFLADGHERILQRAYDLGRRAAASGLGVLDMAKLHQEVLAKLVLARASSRSPVKLLGTAEIFLLEALSPFEAMNRGFRESNERLQQLIRQLEEKNKALARFNTELGAEVRTRKRTEKALRRSEQTSRELSNRILHVQEEERTRISRELHDEVGQALTAINVNLALLKRSGSEDVRTWKRKLEDTQNLLERTMETVHHFARELRPAMLDDLGLLPALRSYVKSFSERTTIKIQLRTHPAAEKLDSECKTVVYRVTQESLNNVAKHAQATVVTLALTQVNGEIRLRVSDNGKAFKVQQRITSKQNKRLGIVGMQERVRLVGGHFQIESKPGCGTTVRMGIPLGPKRLDGEPSGSRD